MAKDKSNYHIRSVMARGQIISLAAMIERNIDVMLAKHFTNNENRQREMMELIFSTERISFKSKYLLFVDILKRKINDAVKFKEEFPSLQKRLQKIAEIRNKFAHEIENPLPMPDEYYEKFDTILVSFKNIEEKTEAYTENQIIEELDKMNSIEDVLLKADKVLFGHG